MLIPDGDDVDSEANVARFQAFLIYLFKSNLDILMNKVLV